MQVFKVLFYFYTLISVNYAILKINCVAESLKMSEHWEWMLLDHHANSL